jgi:hypothetical protein
MKKATAERGACLRKPVGARPGEEGTVREGAAPPQLYDEPERDYELFQAYWREGAARSLRDISARLGAPTPRWCAPRWRWDARIAVG